MTWDLLISLNSNKTIGVKRSNATNNTSQSINVTFKYADRVASRTMLLCGYQANNDDECLLMEMRRSALSEWIFSYIYLHESR